MSEQLSEQEPEGEELQKAMMVPAEAADPMREAMRRYGIDWH